MSQSITADIESSYPIKKPTPLIKTMYIRDPSRSQFQVKKYDRFEMEEDEDLMFEAYGDIKYDQYLEIKPEIIEELQRQHEEYLKDQREYDYDDVSLNLENKKHRAESIFRVKKIMRNTENLDEDDGYDSESSGFAHYFKCSQKSLKIGTLINQKSGEISHFDEDILTTVMRNYEGNSVTSPSENEC